MRPLICCLLLCVTLTTASAQEMSAKQSGCQLRVATGKKGRGFSKLFQDIQTVCGSVVALCEVESEGGISNSVALSANAADLGFVQLDTLHTMKQSDDNVAALQAVIPMNSNLLHVLVRRDGFKTQGERSLASLFQREQTTRVVNKVSELKGLPVAVVGSAQLVARLLDQRFGYGWRFVDADTDEQALAALNAGEVAAVFFMNGWPSSLVSALAREGNTRLIAYDLPAQAPYQVMQKNYPKLGVYNLPLLAAPNLLMTRPFKPEGQHGQWVAALQHCLLSHLDALQEGAFEPGWKEIKRAEDTFGWPRFSAETSGRTNPR